MSEDRLTSLYRRYGTVIYARCRAMLADDAAAEDATQETFVRVHRHLEEAPDEKEALFWIYRIATNLCLNEIRGRRRRPVPVDSPLAERRMDGGGEEERLVDRDLARRLVASLPERIRPAAWLYHVDGFEQEEIGRILGVSRRTIATWLSLAAEDAHRFLVRAE